MNILDHINIEQLTKAIYETLYMTFTSLVIAVLLGLFIGILLFLTKSDGLNPTRVFSRITDFIINILRSIPFIILMFNLIPFARFLTGSMLGANAAIPALAIAAAPFYARLVIISLNEVDKGVIEAALSMGASITDVIFKVVIKEALPSLVSGIGVCAISIVSYTAMAGAIGSGGLGNLAYMYGLARYNPTVLYTTTAIIVIIVLIIQGISDYIVKRIDKR